MYTILMFILIFSIIVFSHEFGHYLLGRLNNIHVVEFSIGMGPKILHYTKNGTLYSIRLLPIGGACMFEGYDDELSHSSNDSDNALIDRLDDDSHICNLDNDEYALAFNNAPVWGRISTILAGPIFNFILAFMLAIIVVWGSGSDKPTVNGLMEGYPIEEAGVEIGDIIISMNNEPIYLAREIYINTLINGNAPMKLEYERAGKLYETTVYPKYNEEAGRYLIGLNGYGEYVPCNNIDVIKYSYYEVRYSLKSTIKSLLMLVKGKMTKDDLSGPVGMVQIIGDVAKESAPYGIKALIINMMAIALLLSVNIGIINLLPLPALDGGRLIFLAIEAIRGKPIAPKMEGMVHLAGIVVLMILMVLVTFNDIMRLYG